MSRKRRSPPDSADDERGNESEPATTGDDATTGDGASGSSSKSKADAAKKAPSKSGPAKSSSKKSNAPSKAAPDDTTPDAPSTGRVELPAFGFASDLLEQHRAGRLASTETDDDSGFDEGVERAVEEAMLAAAAAAVDAEGPARIFDFADRVAATAFEDETEKKPRRLESWMTFALAEEIFAMPVEPVLQVVRVSEITRVPHAPRPIRGVMNLRGRVIPVIDLRLRVGLDPTPLDRSARVVAVGSRGRVLGLLVDAVHQVTRIDADQIQPPPDDVMTIQSDYILGVYHQADTLFLLLDVDRALIIRDEGAA